MLGSAKAWPDVGPGMQLTRGSAPYRSETGNRSESCTFSVSLWPGAAYRIITLTKRSKSREVTCQFAQHSAGAAMSNVREGRVYPVTRPHGTFPTAGPAITEERHLLVFRLVLREPV